MLFCSVELSARVRVEVSSHCSPSCEVHSNVSGAILVGIHFEFDVNSPKIGFVQTRLELCAAMNRRCLLGAVSSIVSS